MIKTVIARVSDEIHQQLKIKVLKDGITIQELLENFIEKYVEDKSEDTK